MRKFFILQGPPGVGKGTNAIELAKKYGYVHISTGELLRKIAELTNALGIRVKETMDVGELVDDATVIEVVEHEINQHPNAKGFAFDGFPRTVAQAELLMTLAIKYNLEFLGVFEMKASIPVLLQRLATRKEESQQQRSDDTPEAWEKRLHDHFAKSDKLLNYFTDNDLPVYPIPSEGDKPTVFKSLCEAIDSALIPVG